MSESDEELIADWNVARAVLLDRPVDPLKVAAMIRDGDRLASRLSESLATAERQDVWKQTVRAIFDELHFGVDNVFKGHGHHLARRIVKLIEERHHDYFCESAPKKLGVSQRRGD